MARRIYLEPLVITGCVDETFAAWSNRLVDEIRHGWWTAVISDWTELELLFASAAAQAVLKGLPRRAIERVKFGPEAENLANRYLIEEVVGVKQTVEARHVAMATVARVDVFVSWSFRQIVNLDRIRAFNAVNLTAGYSMLEIRSPMEVFHEEDA
jgi:hypothetical protein